MDSSEVWPNFDETVLELKTRLRQLKEAFEPLKAAKVDFIPIELQEEVTKLYDEHGGLDILMKVTNIGYLAIKRWHKSYKLDPEYFLKAKSNPKRKTRDFVCRVLSQTEGKLQPRKMKSRIEFKGISDLDEIRSLLPVDVQIQCSDLKRLMMSKRSQGGSGIDNEIKEKVAELILDVGHVRPIALLTGLNERVISGWKNLN